MRVTSVDHAKLPGAQDLIGEYLVDGGNILQWDKVKVTFSG